MRRSLPAIAIALATLLPTRTAHPAPPAPPEGWNEFLKLFDGETQKHGIIGASVLVVRDGRVVARHHHGLADQAFGQRVDDRTLFHWGSITKTLTAIAIMQLVERKRISLDDHIVKWVPELRQVHDPYNGSIETITLRMLLSHSAGFQGPTWPYKEDKPWEPFEPTSWSQLVAMMPYQELHFLPGSRFGYSNPGFIYLARVIEAVTGDPWQVYVHKNIFMPLGLAQSYFGATPYHLAADRANSYELVRDPDGKTTLRTYGREFDPGITIPNGGWNAPLSDLGRYVAFLSAASDDPAMRKRYEEVLPHRVLEQMWRPLVSTDPAEADAPWLGLSFFITRPDAPPIIGHTGSQAGFTAFFYLNPRTATGIVAAFNTTGQKLPHFGALRKAALTLLSREPAR